MTALFNALNRLDLDLTWLSYDGAHTYTFALIAIISAAVSIKGISLISKRNRHREYFVRISVGKNSSVLLGFVDTGNLVKDQISGKSIIFIDRSAISSVIDPLAEEKFLKGEILYEGSRLISISGAQGSRLKLVFPPDRITLKEKSEKESAELYVDCLISLTDIKSNYQAIIPEDIIKLNI